MQVVPIGLMENKRHGETKEPYLLAQVIWIAGTQLGNC